MSRAKMRKEERMSERASEGAEGGWLDDGAWKMRMDGGTDGSAMVRERGAEEREKESGG